jgi:hypothetical protein
MGLANIIGNSARAYRDGHVFWTNSFAQLINYEDKSPQKAASATIAPKSNYAGKFFGALTGLPYGLIKSIIIATHHNYEDSFIFIGKVYTKIEPSLPNSLPNQSNTNYIDKYDKPATIAARLLLGIIGVLPAVALSPLPLGIGLVARICAESAYLGAKTFELLGSIFDDEPKSVRTDMRSPIKRALGTLAGLPGFFIAIPLSLLFFICRESGIVAEKTVNLVESIFVLEPKNKIIDKRSRFKRATGTLAGLPGFFITLAFSLPFAILRGLFTSHSRLRGFLLAPFVHIYKNWLIKPFMRVGEEVLRMGTNEFNPVRFKANLIAVFTFGLGKSLYKYLSGNTEMVYPHKKQAWNAQHAEYVGDNSPELLQDYELFNTIHKKEPVSVVAGVRKTFLMGCNPSPVKETLSTLLHGYNQYRKTDAENKSLKNYLESTSAIHAVFHLKSVYEVYEEYAVNPIADKIDAVVKQLKQ